MRPSIQVELDANDGSSLTGYGFVDTGSWAIVKTPSIAMNWQYRGADPVIKRQYDVADEGIISNDGSIAYLGPCREYTATAEATGEQIRLVVPRAATLAADPHDILEALTRAAELLKIGARNERVTAIAAPTDEITWTSKGRQRGDDGFWVKDAATLNEANETWIHEYVHTRQQFRYTESTQWLTEGTADYFSCLAALHRRDISFERFHRFLTRPEDSNAVLVDRSTWSSGLTVYRQGRRVCAALDAMIREETGHRYSLDDIIAKLNRQAAQAPPDARQLTNPKFATALTTVTGVDLEPWLKRYVWGSAAPSVPTDRAAFGLDDGPKREPEPEADRECPICETTTETRLCPGCGYEVGPNEPPAGPEPSSTGEGGYAGVCPVCGTQTDTELCPGCGYDLVPRCQVCNTTGGPDDEYCPTCGYPLREYI